MQAQWIQELSEEVPALCVSLAHNDERKERGKEHEAPTQLIEISELTHAARVTKNRHNYKVCTQEKWLILTMKLVAHSSSVRDM